MIDGCGELAKDCTTLIRYRLSAHLTMYTDLGRSTTLKVWRTHAPQPTP